MSKGEGQSLSGVGEGGVPEVTMESASPLAIPGTPWILVVLAEPEEEISFPVCS